MGTKPNARLKAVSGKTLRIVSWNVAGLRGLLARRPTAIADLLAAENIDILCLQETKLQTKHIGSVSARLDLGPEWVQIWECSTLRLGHAGVAMFTRVKIRSFRRGLAALGPLVSGRVITAHFANFRLVTVYSPNAGENLKNIALRVDQFDPALGRHVRAGRKPTVLAGDLNVAPEAEDVYDPVRLGRLQSPCFSTPERQSFRDHYACTMVDAFRACHPGVRAFTFYSYRHAMRQKRKGWRLDHFMVQPILMQDVVDCFIAQNVVGSDHLPIGLVLRAG